MNKVFIGIGSNIGDRTLNIEMALAKINDSVGQILAQSSIYETESWGFKSDNPFLNLVVLIDTALNPIDLLDALKRIEKLLGRQRRSIVYQNRPIDLDILFFNESVVNNPNLTIPHPYIQERMFVLKPLADIAPDLVHPVLKKSIRIMAENCMDKSSIKKIDKIQLPDHDDQSSPLSAKL